LNTLKYLNIAVLSILILIVTGCTRQDSYKQDLVRVTRVVDGDTFVIDGGEKVRLIGVNSPESVKPNEEPEPYGLAASNFTKRLLSGQRVKLVFDVEPTDRYGRLLAYVYLEDGRFVNEILLREGYAQVMTIPPNVAHAKDFLRWQREARDAGKGLWGEKPGTPIKSKLIKGNINSRGEKIYHLPTGKYYNETKAEVLFANEKEARAAGFRPSKE